MSFRLPRPRHLLVGFSLNRARHDFCEEDRTRLNVLRPHLIRAYENAQAWDRVVADHRSLEEAIEASRYGLVLLGDDGRVGYANSLGLKAVDRYFGRARTRPPDRLPDDLVQWVEHQARIPEAVGATGSSQPLVVERDGRRLVVRLVSGASRSVLVLREEPASIEPRLRALGLSDREAQVLAWVVRGKTSAEIGMIFDVTGRTVEKHLESIYRKLGVHNRAAAVAHALECASSLSE
jgi:DNA-binding CsgD family transcriptional regulator